MANAPETSALQTGLSDEQADSRFASLLPFSKLAIGVSGGSDSIALLRLLHAWRSRTGWPGQFLVLTVDHALRPESADEARFVARLCADLEMPHQTLVWEGGKPASNLQAAARTARYALMRAAMMEAGAQALVIGHHLDDQVETFLDRLTRGSGVYGLGSMRVDEPAGPEGLRVLRPLLNVSKDELVATLRRFGQDWCEDPSNQKTNYKRTRLRNLAAALALEGFETARLVETARRMRRTAEAIDQWVASVFEHHVEEHPAGPMRLSAKLYDDLPKEVRLRLLSKLIGRVRRREYPVRMSSMENADAALRLDGASKATLGGAVLCRRGDDVFVWAELGREPPQVRALESGECSVWEGRFRVEASAHREPDARLWIGPFGCAPQDARKTVSFGDWPTAAFAASPAVWSDEMDIRLPGSADCELGSLRNLTMVRLGGVPDCP